MGKGRLEAFSDGVMAVIITIMVLELKSPTTAGFDALLKLEHPLLNYILSFLVVAIMWVNHHHMLSQVARVNAEILWANMNLLFWMSLIPVATAYLGESRATPLAVAIYGALMATTAVSYGLLQQVIMRPLAHAAELVRYGRRAKRKNLIGMCLYSASVPLAFVSIYASFAIFILVPVSYFVPDRRLEELAGGGD